MTETDSKPFLSRWASRKAASQSGSAEPEAAEQLDEAAGNADTEQTEEEAALSDEELCARYELPDPESCTQEDQLDGFFDGRVPDRLRQLAMRRIWRLNPLFRFADEMVEYGEDFTDAATVIPDMQTAYKVGKGYLDKLLAEEQQAEAEQNAEQLIAEELASDGEGEAQTELAGQPDEAELHSEQALADQQADTADQPDESEQPPASEPVLSAAADQPFEQANPAPDAELPAIRPKRMVFTKRPN